MVTSNTNMSFIRCRMKIDGSVFYSDGFHPRPTTYLDSLGVVAHMNPPAKILVTTSNVAEWPKFKKLLDEGKIVADKTGRLRYPHGAPVGHLVLTRTAKDGTPRYQESAEDWFDPGSRRAQEFVWPE